VRQLFKQVKKNPIVGFNRCKPRQLSEYIRKIIKPELKININPKKAIKTSPIKIKKAVNGKKIIENIYGVISITGFILGGAIAPYVIYELRTSNYHDCEQSKIDIVKSVALWSIIGIPCGIITGVYTSSCMIFALEFLLTELKIVGMFAAGGVLLAAPKIGYIYVIAGTALALQFILAELEIVAVFTVGGILLAAPTIGYICVTDKN